MCSDPDCGQPAKGRGLCSRHYQKARYHGLIPEYPQRTCPQCGELFSARKWKATYCSAKCFHQARHLRTYPRPDRAVACTHCGGSMDGLRAGAQFCSPRCVDLHRNANARAERADAPRPPCVRCGQPIPFHARRFCSKKCCIANRRPEKYGFTKAELDALLAQHDTCAICGGDKWGHKGPVVDHDHATGRVRGILCGNCNMGLGRFRDDPELVRAAADYLVR